MLRSVKRTPGRGAKIVPSETLESLYRRSGVIEEEARAEMNNRVLPASKEKKLGMLAIGGQAPKEVRFVGFCDTLAESGIPLLEGEQLRELIGGVGQSADAILVVIASGECGGSGSGRVKRSEDREE